MSVDLTTLFQVAVTGNANGTAAGCNGLAAYSMDVQGLAGGSRVNFEGLSDNLGGATETWRAVTAYPIDGTAAVLTSTTNGCWVVPCGGLAKVRARIDNYASGTIYVQGYGSYAPRW